MTSIKQKSEEEVVHCFHNCRVLRNGELRRDELWVRGDKIITAEEGHTCGATVVRRNCLNKIISPGFIDIQLNGAYGVDFTATDDMPAALSQCSLLITQTGCTAYCPTVITSSPEEYIHRLPQIRYTPGSQRHGATILGVHIEGPLISMNKRGCHPPHLVSKIPKMQSVEDATKFLDSIYGPDRSSVVMLTLAPEHEGALEVITAAASEGIVVSMGHSESSYARGCEGVASGATALTHLFSAMNAFGHKEPALPGLISGKIPDAPRLCELKLPKKFNAARAAAAGLCDIVMSSPGHTPRAHETLEEVSNASEYCSPTLHYGLIADCVHTHPYSLSIAYRANRHGLCLITDAMAALGLPDGSYILGETEVEVGGSPRKALKKGTDTLAGVVASMDQCVRLFAEQTACGLAYALTAASLHPARCLGIEQWKGQLNAGADADFVLLDDNVKIHETWCMGEQVYDCGTGLSAPDLPSELKAMTHIVPPEATARITTY